MNKQNSFEKFLLSICVAIIMPLAAAAQVSGQYIVESSSKIKVRKEASFTAPIIGSVAKGNIVTVSNVSGQWAKIQYKKLNGYVLISYLKKVDSPVQKEEVPITPVVTTTTETVAPPPAVTETSAQSTPSGESSSYDLSDFNHLYLGYLAPFKSAGNGLFALGSQFFFTNSNFGMNFEIGTNAGLSKIVGVAFKFGLSGGMTISKNVAITLPVRYMGTKIIEDRKLGIPSSWNSAFDMTPQVNFKSRSFILNVGLDIIIASNTTVGFFAGLGCTI